MNQQLEPIVIDSWTDGFKKETRPDVYDVESFYAYRGMDDDTLLLAYYYDVDGNTFPKMWRELERRMGRETRNEKYKRLCRLMLVIDDEF